MNGRSIRNVVIFLLAAGGLALAARYALPPSGGAGMSKDPHAHGQGHGHEHAEGTVEMPDAKVAAARIELVTAAAATIRKVVVVNGMLQPNQEAVVQVTPRFPGIARDIRRRVGDRVEAGAVLAVVESNQSLTAYELKAPIAGTVIDRQISLGEYASEQKPAFVIADLSTVWVDLSVHRRDFRDVKPGEVVIIDPADGGEPIRTTIAYVSPVGNTDTQSTLARAVVKNDGQRLRPGLFVTGRIVVSERQVPLAIKVTALQTIENRQVVFVRTGDAFEPREVELGERDGEHVEVLFGLLEGDTYAARNSFVIKAELAKGSATHEH